MILFGKEQITVEKHPIAPSPAIMNGFQRAMCLS
jgi:hypothetical protein